jgi:hypothetical protein
MPIFDYLFSHTDICPRCLRCDWCDEGVRLLKEASKAAGDAIVHGLLDERPKAQA